MFPDPTLKKQNQWEHRFIIERRQPGGMLREHYVQEIKHPDVCPMVIFNSAKRNTEFVSQVEFDSLVFISLKEYNQARPDSALGFQPPTPEAI